MQMLYKTNSKTIIQLIIISFILLIIYLTYGYYFKTNNNNPKQISIKNKSIENDSQELIKSEEVDNLIEKIEYNSEDLNGNSYYIASETGKIDIINSNVISMYLVSAVIKLNDSSKIDILSKKANYNIQNFDTEFSGDIKIIYQDNEIFTENLDFNFKDSKIYIYNNIVIKNILNNTILEADRIEIDLITKNSKISSKDSLEKSLVIRKN